MNNVEDIYPLSPMQAVMLLYAKTATGDDVLFNQFCYRINGPLDPSAFGAAWQRLVSRHAALRTAFVWENLKQSLQVVRKGVPPCFELLDWADMGEQEQSHALEELKGADRRRPLDLGQAPLMRLVLVRLSSTDFWFLWSSHHLILDRWCLGVLYRELFSAYRSVLAGEQDRLPPAQPFREYINWLQKQEPARAKQFWREQLRDIVAPSPLLQRCNDVGGRVDSRSPHQTRKLKLALSESLRRMARAQGVTLSIVLQGALALLIHRISDRQHVLFGATVSGRPPELPGVENIVGSLVNNLPVVVTVDCDKRLGDWLKAMQTAQHQRAPFEYASLSDIHRWCEWVGDTALFDTLFVWLSPAPIDAPSGLRFEPLRGDTSTAYPLTISVAEDEETLTLHADGQPGFRLIGDDVDLLAEMEVLLVAMTGCSAESRLSDLGVVMTTPESGQAERQVSISGAVDLHRRAMGGTPIALTAGREALDVVTLREVLQTIWRDLLRTEATGLDQNFFEVGGNSILAARLHADIEAATRQSVPLMALFQGPTIRQMAQTLSEHDWPLRPDIVNPIATRGVLPPLFCIASPEVNTLGYMTLARHLPDDRPIIVLQSPPDSEHERRLDPDEIPALAGDYIAAMRAVQTDGPYHLLGMCTGAHVAVEMAQQLNQQDAAVGFVGLINTWAYFTVSRVYRLVRIFNRVDYYRQRLSQMLGMRIADQMQLIRQTVRRKLTSENTMAAAIGGCRAEAPNDAASAVQTGQQPDLSLAESHNPWIEDVGWAHCSATRPYRVYRGTLTVFRIRKQPIWRIQESTLGWNKSAEKVRVETLTGRDHLQVLREPNVRDLAVRLANCLRAEQSKHQNED